MSWELVEKEVDVRAGYTAVVDMIEPGSLRLLSRESSDPVLVLVESVSGIPDALGNVYVQTYGTNFENSEAPGASARVLTGRIKRAAGVTVQITARVQDRFRVSLLRLKAHLWKGLTGTPCDMCKSIAKILARTFMAASGMPFTGFGEATSPLLELDFEKLVETVKGTPLWNWIVSSKLEMLAIALIGPLYLLLKGINAVESAVYAEACRIVGACKSDGPGLALA